MRNGGTGASLILTPLTTQLTVWQLLPIGQKLTRRKRPELTGKIDILAQPIRRTDDSLCGACLVMGGMCAAITGYNRNITEEGGWFSILRVATYMCSLQKHGIAMDVNYITSNTWLISSLCRKLCLLYFIWSVQRVVSYLFNLPSLLSWMNARFCHKTIDVYRYMFSRIIKIYFIQNSEKHLSRLLKITYTTQS